MNRITLIANENKLLCVDSKRKEFIDVVSIVGRGGTSICYKARKVINGKKDKWCIIKEFYPDQTTYGSSVCYERDSVGGKIVIKITDSCMSEERRENLINAEKERQKRILEHECEMSRRLRISGKDNVPYFMEVEKIDFEEDMGDSSYLILDTLQGETLHSAIKSRGGKLPFSLAIEYFEKILEILRVLEKENCCHCDIKASNLWLEGNEANTQMILLDFGSAFDREKYEIDMYDEAEIIELADSIIYEASIGSSTEGFAAGKLHEFYDAKVDYMRAYDFEKYEYANKLVSAIQNIDISVDIFSSMQLLYKMITGESYCRFNGSIPSIMQKAEQTELVISQLVKMMNKNGIGLYHSVHDVKEDLEILKTLYSKGAHPKVLIDGLMKELSLLPEIDELLLADVEEKR